MACMDWNGAGSEMNEGAYDKDGLLLEINILGKGVLALDGISGLVQLEISRELDGVSSESGVLSSEQGSETRELGEGGERDDWREREREGGGGQKRITKYAIQTRRVSLILEKRNVNQCQLRRIPSFKVALGAGIATGDKRALGIPVRRRFFSSLEFSRTASILRGSDVHPLVGRVVSNAKVVLELLTELIQGSLGLLGGGSLQLNGILRRALLGNLRDLNVSHFEFKTLELCFGSDLIATRPQKTLQKRAQMCQIGLAKRNQFPI